MDKTLGIDIRQPKVKLESSVQMGPRCDRVHASYRTQSVMNRLQEPMLGGL